MRAHPPLKDKALLDTRGSLLKDRGVAEKLQGEEQAAAFAKGREDYRALLLAEIEAQDQAAQKLGVPRLGPGCPRDLRPDPAGALRGVHPGTRLRPLRFLPWS